MVDTFQQVWCNFDLWFKSYYRSGIAISWWLNRHSYAAISDFFKTFHLHAFLVMILFDTKKSRKLLFLGNFPWLPWIHLKLKFLHLDLFEYAEFMLVFILSALDWKYPVWANLVRKIKIVSLSWNLVPRLFQICKIRW